MRLAQVDSGTGPVVVEVGDGWMRPLAYHADLTTLICAGVNPRCLPCGGRFPAPLALISPVNPGKIVASRLDHEVQLAVVIGRWLARIGPEEALAGVFGYMDTVCPFGPMVVTPDDAGDIPGDMQRLGEVLAHTSTYCTLEPGDLVLTGSQHGSSEYREVGVLRDPMLAGPGTR